MNYGDMHKRPLSFYTAIVVLICLCFAAFQPASALEKPRPLAIDSRIQTILYGPNQVFSFLGHYGYQSIIEFAEDEEVLTISLGDSVPWQVQPVGFRIFIKPVE